jgi:hypothetical protein
VLLPPDARHLPYLSAPQFWRPPNLRSWDRLLAELAEVPSADAMAGWAHRSLPAKNTLSVTDAQLVEIGFRERLAIVGDGSEHQVEFTGTSDGTIVPVEPKAEIRSVPPKRSQDATTAAALPRRGVRIPAKTIRLRDKDHRKFVSTQPCLVCGRSPADAHHLRFAQPRALGRKVSDEFTVPVCRVHHRELHRHGDEAAWWQRIHIDPLPIAHRLWQHARPNGSAVVADEHSSQPAIVSNRSERRASSTITDRGEGFEKTPMVTDRPASQ